jgi:hypothetical protein
MERLWAAGRSSPDQGLAITPEEVAWLLSGAEAAREESNFLVTDPAAMALGGEIAAAEGALDRDPTWARLIEAFELDPAEADLLAVLAATEADPGLRRVIAYLHDDARQTAATPDLSRRLAARDGPWCGETLSRWRLASPSDGGAPESLTTGWRIDPAVSRTLTDGVWRDPALAKVARVVSTEILSHCIPLNGAALEQLRACDDLCGIELVGPAGVGRETLAARFAVGRGCRLVAVDLAMLAAHGMEAREGILRTLRQARFSGDLAYFRDAETASGEAWSLARGLGVAFLRGARQGSSGTTAIALAPPSLGERLALWRARTDAPPPQALTTHRLTPAEIDRLAAAPGDPETRRPTAPRPDHTLLSSLACPYDWSDLVLPGEVDRALRDFADQIRLRWSVYDDWGFGRLAHLGLGVAALFAGPSGTGKTMAAQVIARSLNLDLYRVDLAGVVNKYVGETEKRLREVFDACEHSGSLLFFDEADALFGGRMQVKDAHDRFANIEINYLLQRIESFDGVTILATNRRNDIDHAFLRRLRFVVEFLPPRTEERLALWRKALHPRAPDGEELLGAIDFPLLAERLLMTGAEIKNTVLAAAFLAKARGERIAMGHLLAAADREMTKQRGKLPLTLREGAAG